MIVGVTASNMRSSPGEMKFVSYEIDDNQLSQALFYESIYMLVALSALSLPSPFRSFSLSLSFFAFVFQLLRPLTPFRRARKGPSLMAG
jgi:hypothetical protein